MCLQAKILEFKLILPNIKRICNCFMVKLPDWLTDWRRKENLLKKRKIEQNDPVEYQNYSPSYQRRVTFSSPSEPKKPNGKLTISSFDGSDPKNPNFFDMIGTVGDSNSFCIGYVDMVNSTKISACLSTENLSHYYENFLNSMSKIIGKYEGKVIKNIGDCLLYYFPQSVNGTSKGLKDCLDCGLSMSKAQFSISQQSVSNKLPPLDYRISSDFGPVLIMRTITSSGMDCVGPTVNMCAKINHYTPRNEFAIGSDLHHLVKGFKEYKFKELKGFTSGRFGNYPIFSLG